MRQQDILAERRRPPLTVRVRGGLPGRPCPGPADCIRRIKELQFSSTMAEAVILPPCLTFCTISPQCIFIVCFYCLAFTLLALYCRNIAAYHILLRVSHLFFLPFSHTPSTYHSTPLRNPAPIARHSHTGQPCACGQHKDKQTLGERRHLARSCAAWRRTSLVPLRLERSASASAAPYAARAPLPSVSLFLIRCTYEISFIFF